MNDRRKFLKGLSGTAAGLAATATAAGAVVTGKAGSAGGKKKFSRDLYHGRGQFPEASAQTSTGKKLGLYADLVKGKVVVINYMAIDNEENFPITKRMVEIARKLGPKLGTEVHFISITSDPVRDTPERLRAFMKRMGVPEHGWEFVRLLSDDESAVLAHRLYRHPRRPDPRTRLDAAHYGNEPVGCWGLFPSSISTEDAVMRINSILPGKPANGSIRRAGPRKLEAAGLPFNNRINRIG